MTGATRLCVALIAMCVVFESVVLGDETTHNYKPDESVTLWLNQIGPYHNPQETYSYYTLPYCAPPTPLQPLTKAAGVLPTLDNTEYINSGFDIRFQKNTPRTEVCSITLTKETAEFFAYAVSNHYWYQQFLDDLPIWGMVGEVVAPEETIRAIEAQLDRPHEIADSTFLFTHKRLSIAYNGPRIIEVNLTSEREVAIQAGKEITFSYNVEWFETSRPFETRFSRYLDYTFFEHQIHWFSIFNSFMMVVFLCGLVALILMRVLKNDYAKYMADEDNLDGLDRGMGDDSGWKQVHNEVFRRPPYISMLAALLGTGFQIMCMAMGVLIVAILKSLYVEYGSTMATGFAFYAPTAVISGYVSGGYYRRNFHPDKSPYWIRTALLTAGLFPGSIMVVLLALNLVATYYRTLNSISFGSILLTVFLWMVVSVPLVSAGTLLGRKYAGVPSFPCRVNPVPRHIPPQPWFSSPYLIAMLTGLLPFGSIFIEMYFVFTSFWNYKFYFVYGFMLLVYCILAIVTCCVTIVAVYFFLNAEDYRWQWLSFLSAASTAVYVFAYSVFYFLFKTNMTGFLQTVFYFGYTSLFCGALGILTGTIGYSAASVFVDRIYRNIKVD